jgi:hypothetical protein
MINEEVHIRAFEGSVTFVVARAKDQKFITFTRHEGFKKAMADQRKISDGRTLAQAERDYMHAALDSWIDTNLEE